MFTFFSKIREKVVVKLSEEWPKVNKNLDNQLSTQVEEEKEQYVYTMNKCEEKWIN